VEINSKMIRGFEIVLAKNDQIDLFANLVSLKDGSFVVCGRVVFDDEKKLLFSNDGEFRGVQRSEFLATCQSIADSHGAELLRRRLPLLSPAAKNFKNSPIPRYMLN